MKPFLVCIHDATPAYARETDDIVRGLAPLLGRRLSVGVVPNWRGEWPLASDPDYCRLLRESSEELLLHGYYHRRRRGWGPTSLLTNGADEMNGLDPSETRRNVERGQQIFIQIFGEPARGFLAPAWQRGHVRIGSDEAFALQYVLGFFTLESHSGRTIRLATWTWDCGRWGPLGRIGDAIGSLLQSAERGVPTLAIHPMDQQRGFWPRILRLIEELCARGYEPITPMQLLEATHVEVRV
jgi:peptidoglycan/xylan/chitin deacetylase (PgdA/CDA1 family)